MHFPPPTIPPPSDPTPLAAEHRDAWTARARLAGTEPRPRAPLAPWAWVREAELERIVAKVPAGKGRAFRAVALWAALVCISNQRRSSSFSVAKAALSKLTGMSPRAIIGTLRDIETAGLIERGCAPTVHGQHLRLRTPTRAQ